MINFIRRYTLLLIAAAIGGLSILSSYMHVTPSPQGVANAEQEAVCFQPYGSPVTPEFKASTTVVKVNWIDGSVNWNGEDYAGLAQYMYDGETDVSICEVWVPLPASVLGDHRMDTLGHEFLHCLTGAFHQ